MSWGVAPRPPRSLSSSSLIRQASPEIRCRPCAENRPLPTAVRDLGDVLSAGCEVRALPLFELGIFAGVESIEELINRRGKMDGVPPAVIDHSQHAAPHRQIKRAALFQVAFGVADDRVLVRCGPLAGLNPLGPESRGNVLSGRAQLAQKLEYLPTHQASLATHHVCRRCAEKRTWIERRGDRRLRKPK